MFTRTFLIAATLLLPLVSYAASAPPGIPHLDPKCPPSALPGFETNTFQYNVPAAKFFNKTGSFFHSEWYTGPISSTHGKDNTPGSTRSGIFNGVTPFTELLTSYSLTPTALTQQFTLSGPPLVFGGVTLTSYTEELRFTSICGGEATYISMTVGYCTDGVGQAYALYDKVRRGAIGGVGDELGAFVFGGTCPAGHGDGDAGALGF
ncbi:hypothetical protein FPV67DRAFT_1730388 [Lyophyllum atratum]|nr:hypothetical protein FPV67DRAFT_1730388 [Lyophyllum atratum]